MNGTLGADERDSSTRLCAGGDLWMRSAFSGDAWSAGALAVVAAVLCSLLAWPAAAAAACVNNEAVRVEQRARLEQQVGHRVEDLPECRAYELVTGESDPLVLAAAGLANFGTRASVTGGALAYYTYYPVGGVTTDGFQYIARRSATAGWQTEAIAPQDEPPMSVLVACVPEVDFAPSLESYVVSLGWDVKAELPDGAPCAFPESPVVPGEPRGYGNLAVKTAPGQGFALVNATPVGAAPGNAQYLGGSTTQERVVFSENAKLVPGAPEARDLYEWNDGVIRLITYVNGEAVEGRLARSIGLFDNPAEFLHTVSASGEDVIFEHEAGGTSSLYVRERAGMAGTRSCREARRTEGCTAQVDLSHGLGASGGGVFQYASVNGSRIFFTDESRLTRTSTAGPGKPDLYEFQTVTEEVTDLTPDATEAADVLGVCGGGESGAYVYFVAQGALNGGAKRGRPNLYVAHEGTVSFVASLNPSTDGGDWQYAGSARIANDGAPTARTSPNGAELAFDSTEALTPEVNNVPAKPQDCEHEGSPVPCVEIFAYDAEDGKLACASCAPSGAAPTAPTELLPPGSAGERGYALEGGAKAAGYLSRNVTEGGAVFFSSSNALLPGVGRYGKSEVYEYLNGELHVLSTGAERDGAVFVDATPSGSDVFLATDEPLTPSRDTGNGESIYDARVGGGFVELPAPVPACGDEVGCHGPSAGGPPAATPGTATFGGAQNVHVTTKLPGGCRGGKMRRRRGCRKPGRRCHRPKRPDAKRRRATRGRHGRRARRARHAAHPRARSHSKRHRCERRGGRKASRRDHRHGEAHRHRTRGSRR